MLVLVFVSGSALLCNWKLFIFLGSAVGPVKALEDDTAMDKTMAWIALVYRDEGMVN